MSTTTEFEAEHVRVIESPHDIASFYAIVAEKTGNQEAAKAACEIADLISQWEPWQPIETAPRDGSRVLVWYGFALTARWRSSGKCPNPFWGWHSGENWVEPTHWMPLPAGPR